jgi:hypothetical protein
MILILVLRQLADGASSPRFTTASADEMGFINGRHRSSPCVPTAQPIRLTLDSIEPIANLLAAFATGGGHRSQP